MTLRAEMTDAVHAWVAESTADGFPVEFIGHDRAFFRNLCISLDVDPDSGVFKDSMLVVIGWLWTVMREEEDNPLPFPMVAPTIRAIVTSLAVGVFGQEEADEQADR